MGEREIDRSTDSASSVRSAFNEDIKCAQNMSQYLIHMLATSDRFELTEQVINCCKERYGTNWRAVLAHLSAFASAEDAHSSLTSEQLAERRNTDETLGNKFRFYGSAKKRSKSCKHCDFVANTKLEYWEHMRCHISGFNCSECSFVTKYKHHMNHHWLSVHDGSKPFKCKKCPYTCVSKSMLTSHLKKHSNVYPYRCANCPYKTKFCNALKKHLRKKLHQPAMVLNPDGTPNPFSVIDVYGTKRGPKQKPTPAKDDDELQLPVTHYLTAAAKKADSAPSQSTASQNQPATRSDLVSAVNLSSQRLLREDESTRSTIDAEEDETSQALVENSAAACSDKTTDVSKLQVPDNTKTTGGFSLFMELGAARPESHFADIPLDLRVSRLVETSRLSVASSSKVSGTRKRKGRAMKLESYPVEENETSEQSDVEVTSEFANSQLNLSRKKIEEAEETVADLLDKFICYFCEITFGNVLMYSMHMDYHGFDDPYTCNMCGLHYTDKISFFLHIGRLKHTE